MSALRAAIYVRQSRDYDGTGLAVERQRTDCEKLCADRGWTIVQVITDNDVSATKGRRPGWADVLTLAESGAVDVIVGWHVDRLTRKLTELEHLIAVSERTGVRVATVSGDLDLASDAGRLVGRILASVARGEVERKSARQRRAAEQSAGRGAWQRTKRAFGYTSDGRILDVEAATVREVFARFNAGASIRSLTTWANTVSTNTEGRPWSPWTIRNMLKNPRYAAIRAHKGVEITTGEWHPIIDEAIYRAAVARLTDPHRASYTGSRARKHLGSFRYRCGKCGATMTVNYQSAYGYRVYRCPACAHQRRADPIDEFVSAVIVERLRRPDLADLLAETAPDVQPLKDKGAALRARLDVLADDYAAGRLTGRQVERANRKIAHELEEVGRQLAAAGRASALAGLLTAPDPGAAWLAADVGVRGQVLDTLATVTVLPVRSGPRDFDPATVGIEWRTA
jgi:DNA invertase Pin-like site-specific DNA recombinase